MDRRTKASASISGGPEVDDNIGIDYNGPRLDLAIPVLNPGIPDDRAKWEAKNIWPELRNAESVWYANKMSEALSKTGVFNSVLVVPDGSVSADFYLLGEIKESNGEDFELSFQLYDTTGKKIKLKAKKKKGSKRKKKSLRLKLRVPPTWYTDPATSNLDPLDPHFAVLATNIAEEIISINEKDQKLAKKN